jgi:hypothetical protein
MELQQVQLQEPPTEAAYAPQHPASGSAPTLATRPSFLTQAGALTRKNLRYQQKKCVAQSCSRAVDCSQPCLPNAPDRGARRLSAFSTLF